MQNSLKKKVKNLITNSFSSFVLAMRQAISFLASASVAKQMQSSFSNMQHTYKFVSYSLSASLGYCFFLSSSSSLGSLIANNPLHSFTFSCTKIISKLKYIQQFIWLYWSLYILVWLYNLFSIHHLFSYKL